ncbi:unnamed protein product, partial [Symbiodinium sp. CCMP2456]
RADRPNLRPSTKVKQTMVAKALLDTYYATHHKNKALEKPDPTDMSAYAYPGLYYTIHRENRSLEVPKSMYMMAQAPLDPCYTTHQENTATEKNQVTDMMAQTRLEPYYTTHHENKAPAAPELTYMMDYAHHDPYYTIHRKNEAPEASESMCMVAQAPLDPYYTIHRGNAAIAKNQVTDMMAKARLDLYYTTHHENKGSAAPESTYRMAHAHHDSYYTTRRENKALQCNHRSYIPEQNYVRKNHSTYLLSYMRNMTTVEHPHLLYQTDGKYNKLVDRLNELAEWLVARWEIGHQVSDMVDCTYTAFSHLHLDPEHLQRARRLFRHICCGVPGSPTVRQVSALPREQEQWRHNITKAIIQWIYMEDDTDNEYMSLMGKKILTRHEKLLPMKPDPNRPPPKPSWGKPPWRLASTSSARSSADAQAPHDGLSDNVTEEVVCERAIPEATSSARSSTDTQAPQDGTCDNATEELRCNNTPSGALDTANAEQIWLNLLEFDQELREPVWDADGNPSILPKDLLDNVAVTLSTYAPDDVDMMSDALGTLFDQMYGELQDIVARRQFSIMDDNAANAESDGEEVHNDDNTANEGARRTTDDPVDAEAANPAAEDEDETALMQ